MINPNHRCVWASDDLAGYDVPASAKAFLQSRGLPCFIGCSTIEFGIYDSTDRCVIGQDFDYPIYIERDGTVWHEPCEQGSEPQFMNSSVELLDQFVSAFLSLDPGGGEASDSCIRTAVEHTIQQLRLLDPPAFFNEKWIWPQIWEDRLAQC